MYDKKEDILRELNKVEQSITHAARSLALPEQNLCQFFIGLISYQDNLEDTDNCDTCELLRKKLLWKMKNAGINITEAYFDFYLADNIVKWLELRLMLKKEISLEDYRMVQKKLGLELQNEFAKFCGKTIGFFQLEPLRRNDKAVATASKLLKDRFSLRTSALNVTAIWESLDETGYETFGEVILEEITCRDYKKPMVSPELTALKVFAKVILNKRNLETVEWAEKFIQNLDDLSVQPQYHVLFEFLYNILVLWSNMENSARKLQVKKIFSTYAEDFLSKAEILFRHGQCENFWKDIVEISNTTKQNIENCFSGWIHRRFQNTDLRGKIQPINHPLNEPDSYKVTVRFTDEEKQNIHELCLAKQKVFYHFIGQKFEKVQGNTKVVVDSLETMQRIMCSLAFDDGNVNNFGENVDLFASQVRQIKEKLDALRDMQKEEPEEDADEEDADEEDVDEEDADEEGAAYENELLFRDEILKIKLPVAVLKDITKKISSFAKDLSDLQQVVSNNFFPDFDYYGRWLKEISKKLDDYELSMGWRTRSSRRRQVAKLKKALCEAQNTRNSAAQQSLLQKVRQLKCELNKEKKVFFGGRSQLLRIVENVHDVLNRNLYHKIQVFAKLLREGNAAKINEFIACMPADAGALQTFFMVNNLDEILSIVAEHQYRVAYKQRPDGGDFAAQNLLAQTILNLCPPSNVKLFQDQLDASISFFSNPENDLKISFSNLDNVQISALMNFILKEFNLISNEELVKNYISKLPKWTYTWSDARWQPVRDLINDKLFAYMMPEDIHDFKQIQDRLDDVFALPDCKSSVVFMDEASRRLSEYTAKITSEANFFSGAGGCRTSGNINYFIHYRGFRFGDAVYPEWLRRDELMLLERIMDLLCIAETSEQCEQLREWFIEFCPSAKAAKKYFNRFVEVYVDCLLLERKYYDLEGSLGLEGLLGRVQQNKYLDKYSAFDVHELRGCKTPETPETKKVIDYIFKKEIIKKMRKCASIKDVFDLLASWKSDPLIQILQQYSYFNQKVFSILKSRYRKFFNKLTEDNLLHIIKHEGAAFTYSNKTFKVRGVTDYIRLMDKAASCNLAQQDCLKLVEILHGCENFDKQKKQFGDAKHKLFQSFLNKNQFDVVLDLYEQVSCFYKRDEIIVKIARFFRVSFAELKTMDLATWHAKLTKAGMTAAVWRAIEQDSDFIWDSLHQFFMVQCLKNDATIAHKFFLEKIWQSTDKSKITKLIADYAKALQTSEYYMDTKVIRDKNIKKVRAVIDVVKKEYCEKNNILAKVVQDMMNESNAEHMVPVILLVDSDDLLKRNKGMVGLNKFVALRKQIDKSIVDGSKIDEVTWGGLYDLCVIPKVQEKINEMLEDLKVMHKVRAAFDLNGENFLKDLTRVSNYCRLVRDFGKEEQRIELHALEEFLYELYNDCVVSRVLPLADDIFKALKEIKEVGSKQFAEIKKSHEAIMFNINGEGEQDSTQLIVQMQLQSAMKRLKALLHNVDQKELAVPNASNVKKSYVRMAKVVLRTARYIKAKHKKNVAEASTLVNVHFHDIVMLIKYLNGVNCVEQLGLNTSLVNFIFDLHKSNESAKNKIVEAESNEPTKNKIVKADNVKKGNVHFPGAVSALSLQKRSRKKTLQRKLKEGQSREEIEESISSNNSNNYQDRAKVFMAPTNLIADIINMLRK